MARKKAKYAKAPRSERGMYTMTIRVPPSLLEVIDDMIRKGYFASRTELARFAIAMIVLKYRELEVYQRQPIPGYR
jgi:Arc/MetJ-type ribon-helix-helix transcriptional regulator